MVPGLQSGTFLVRNSENMPHSFALSLRHGETVKHYRIRNLDNKGYYITSKSTFPSLIDLVSYHMEYAGCLECTLSTPCSGKSSGSDSFTTGKTTWEIKRDRLKITYRLGAGYFGEVWKGVLDNTTEVAVKKLKSGTMSREAFLNEAGTMAQLCHHHLAQVHMNIVLHTFLTA